MDNIKYADVKLKIEEESGKYNDQDAKDIRWCITQLQGDISYYQYRIYLIQNKLSELNVQYQKAIGVYKDETVAQKQV